MLPMDIIVSILKLLPLSDFLEMSMINKALYIKSRKYINHKISERFPDNPTCLILQLNYGNWRVVIEDAKKQANIVRFIRNPTIIKILLLQLQIWDKPSSFLTYPFLEYLLETGQIENYKLAINLEGNRRPFYKYLLEKNSPQIQKIKGQISDEDWEHIVPSSIKGKNISNILLALKRGTLNICKKSLNNYSYVTKNEI